MQWCIFHHPFLWNQLFFLHAQITSLVIYRSFLILFFSTYILHWSTFCAIKLFFFINYHVLLILVTHQICLSSHSCVTFPSVWHPPLYHSLVYFITILLLLIYLPLPHLHLVYMINQPSTLIHYSLHQLSSPSLQSSPNFLQFLDAFFNTLFEVLHHICLFLSSPYSFDFYSPWSVLPTCL